MTSLLPPDYPLLTPAEQRAFRQQLYCDLAMLTVMLVLLGLGWVYLATPSVEQLLPR